MAIALNRIDDRLIHGQVVVGWGQPLELRFIMLVDDDVAASEWEQELYRMGVPPEMEVYFSDVASAADALLRYSLDPRIGILLVGDIRTMQRLVAENPAIKTVNVGGASLARKHSALALRVSNVGRRTRASRHCGHRGGSHRAGCTRLTARSTRRVVVEQPRCIATSPIQRSLHGSSILCHSRCSAACLGSMS